MKRYSVRLLTGILFSLCAVLAFNYAVDPYAMFDVRSVEGFNQYKPEVERYTRLSKVYQVSRDRPQTALLASSRGLVIPEDVIAMRGEVASNVAIPSGSTYELMRMFQHVASTGRLKRVILALDERFSGGVQPNFVERRLNVLRDGSVNDERWMQQLQDSFSALLSVSALRSSVRTIRKQRDDPAVLGAREYKRQRVTNAGGNRQLFRTLESSMLLDKKILASDSCDQSQAKAVSKYADYFRKIVEQSYRDGIELIIYFSPVHARYYEVKCMVGDWGGIEAMKRQVVATVEELAVTYDIAPYDIWDFSGYSTITTEVVPQPGDVTTTMRWYWEGSHYTEETAISVFDRIAGDDAQDSEFGIQISSDNIEQHLAKIRSDRASYVDSHQAEISELRSLVR